VARTISVADDVFEWLKKEKGDKSYSELLREFKKTRSDLSEVNGVNALGDVTQEDIDKAVKEAEKGTVEEINEMFS